MKLRRPDALKLCYIFPYPPSTGIEDHLNNTALHPFCNDSCEARNGTRFVNVGIDSIELQYWLPTLRSYVTCPPGYDVSGVPLHRSKNVPGLWHDDRINEEKDGNTYRLQAFLPTEHSIRI